MEYTHLFVSTHSEGRTAPCVIDVQNLETGLGFYSGETLEEVSRRYPNVKLMTHEEYTELHDAAMTTDPVRITKKKFIEMLEVLPPMNWRGDGEAQSFMMSEFTSGNITGCYCKIGNKYFSFNGPATLTHEEIVAKCKATMKP